MFHLLQFDDCANVSMRLWQGPQVLRPYHQPCARLSTRIPCFDLRFWDSQGARAKLVQRCLDEKSASAGLAIACASRTCSQCLHQLKIAHSQPFGCKAKLLVDSIMLNLFRRDDLSSLLIMRDEVLFILSGISRARRV